MQRWLRQVRTERSQMYVQLHRMAVEVPEATVLYLKMRECALRIRGEAMTAINKDFWPDEHVAGNPYLPNVYYSDRRLIYKVCELHGIFVADMGPEQQEAAMQYGDGQHAVPAYLQTYTDQPHVLVIDRDPRRMGLHHAQSDAESIGLWTWYAANCLAKFFYDEPMYSGPAGEVETIAPFNPRYHAGFWHYAHSFAKGLLHLPPECPMNSLCGCNRIESLFVRRPPQHPQATGELPSDAIRQHAAQQQDYGQYGTYGQAAPPSRGMTPPNGIPGDRLREYRRQQTDPNLRNPNDHS